MKVRVIFWKSLLTDSNSPTQEINLADHATIEDVLAYFRSTNPALGARLNLAVPTTSGRAMPPTEPVKDGQEILFIPIMAGG